MRTANVDTVAAPSGGRSIRATATVYIGGALLAKSARFLLIPLYVHQLARADVGLLLFLEAVSLGLGTALTFSLGQAAKRFYVDYTTDQEADNFVAALWCIGFTAAILLGAVLAAAALIYGRQSTWQVPVEFLVLAIVSGTLRSNIGIARERFIAREAPYQHSLFNIGQFLTTATLAIIAVAILKLGVRGALWADITGLAVWNGLTAHLLLRGRWPNFKSPELSAAIRYSLPAMPHSMSAWALAFADRLILERFVPLALVGVYSVGYQSAAVLHIFAVALVNASLPKFLRSAAADAGRANYSRVLTLQFATIIGIALPLIAFAPEAIRVIATPEYSEAIPVMRIVAAALIFHGLYNALLPPLLHRKQTLLVSMATGVGLLTNVAFNILLIPRLGTIGAGVATLLSYGTSLAILAPMVARHYPIPLDYRGMAPIVMFAAVAAFGTINSDSAEFLAPVAAKFLWLAVFYIPVLFLPGFLSPGAPPLLGRLRKRSPVPTPTDL